MEEDDRILVQARIDKDKADSIQVLIDSKKYRSKSHFTEVAVLKLLREEGGNGTS